MRRTLKHKSYLAIALVPLLFSFNAFADPHALQCREYAQEMRVDYVPSANGTKRVTSYRYSDAQLVSFGCESRAAAASRLPANKTVANNVKKAPAPKSTVTPPNRTASPNLPERTFQPDPLENGHETTDTCWTSATATKDGQYTISPTEFAKTGCDPNILKQARSLDMPDEKTGIDKGTKSTQARNATSPTTGSPGSKLNPSAPEEESFLKKYLWGNSFDQAADASKAAADKAKATDCAGNKACMNAADTANEVAEQQKTFADISRATGAVGIAATGSAIATEMLVVDNSQASSLKKVAKIQSVAGKANIVAGATDIGLAAVAYTSQKEKLEDQIAAINKQLADKNLTPAQVKDLQKKYNEAIEKTTAASLAHAGWGAAKLGAGALSLSAAKSAREGQKMLEANARMPVIVPLQPIGALPNYQNNSPSFVVPTGSGNSIINSTPSGAVTSSGSSVATAGKKLTDNFLMPKSTDRIPTPTSGGSIGGLTASTSGGSAAANAKRDPAAVGVQPTESSSDAEYGSGGGGGLGYKGSSSSGDDGLANIVSSLLGGGDSSGASSAQAPNAQQANQAGFQATEENPEEGVSSENVSLFDQVRAKHLKMLANGNLLGRTK